MDVDSSVSSGVARITLSRPRALNALSLGMLEEMGRLLHAWRDDDAVSVVVIDGAGDRGLCAGGDVRALRESAIQGRIDEAISFFRTEYAVNAMIAEYPKPVVAFADGITMGGGIGIAGHATIRIVTETSKLAMPETRIGLTPDVGGSLLLARAPGRIGEYLGLTGGVMDAADAIFSGFADVAVSRDAWPEIIGALAALPNGTAPSEVRDVVERFAVDPGASTLAAQQDLIDELYAGTDVAEIMSAARAHSDERARRLTDELDEMSPTSLTVTLEAIRRARELPGIREALAQEYALVLWFVTTQADLREGIRAQLVDKDRSPKWTPATIGELTGGEVVAAFSYRPAIPLWDARS